MQQKLRTSLLEAFCEASQAGRQPTAKEICKTSIPYLDAFVEESLRHSCVISVNMRVAIRDADVLGYVVPKGTDVYMLVSVHTHINIFPAIHFRGGISYTLHLTPYADDDDDDDLTLPTDQRTKYPTSRNANRRK